MSVCAGHSMVRDIPRCESCMWVAMQKWLSAGLEGKFTLCPPHLPAWMPLSCLWGKLVAAWRREVQCTGATGSALKALPAMGMGPGTLGCSQSAQNCCSYCNQDMKQIMLAGWWTLLATRAGGLALDWAQAACWGKLDGKGQDFTAQVNAQVCRKAVEEPHPAQLLVWYGMVMVWYGMVSYGQQRARKGRDDNHSAGPLQRKSSCSLPYSHLERKMSCPFYASKRCSSGRTLSWGSGEAQELDSLHLPR